MIRDGGEKNAKYSSVRANAFSDAGWTPCTKQAVCKLLELIPLGFGIHAVVLRHREYILEPNELFAMAPERPTFPSMTSSGPHYLSSLDPRAKLPRSSNKQRPKWECPCF